jgi:hypothetical protein
VAIIFSIKYLARIKKKVKKIYLLNIADYPKHNEIAERNLDEEKK